MIRVQCSKCGTTLEAPQELAGKQAACPKCRAPITVPLHAAKRTAPPQTNPVGVEPEINPWANVPIQPNPADQPQSTLGNADDYRLGVAAVLSFLIPGLGQVFKRQVRRGLYINAIVLTLIFAIPTVIFLAAVPVAAIVTAASPLNAGLALVVFLFAGILSLASIICGVLYWRWQVRDAAGVP